jgi:hypothetical protein
MRSNSFARFWLGASVLAASMGFSTTGLAECTTCLQDRPIKLGVSGSSQTLLRINNLLYCYAGTLGALVTDGTYQYILSNNHVLAKENENLQYGSDTDNRTIIQEANLDEGTCTINGGEVNHAVAQLIGDDLVTILFGKGRNKPENTVDAAIAQVDGNKVSSDGYILDIGTVNGTAIPSQDLPVQKTGRTTAHTFGKIDATDVTLDVSYESGTARFVHQIRIRRPCGDAGFSAAGDSGSLIVTVPDSENGDPDPQAVGLLFAGSDTDTFANPIATQTINGVAVEGVLDALKVSMVSAPDGTTPGAMLSDYNLIAANCPTSGGGGGGGSHGHGPHFATGGRVGLNVASEVKARHSDEIFVMPDVVGHGVGADENGNAVIEIYVSSKARRTASRPFPTEIEGIPVSVIETGPVRAY